MTNFTDAQQRTHGYEACRTALGEDAWTGFAARWSDAVAARTLSAALTATRASGVPEYLAELARLEEVCWEVEGRQDALPESTERLGVNPTLRMLELPWSGLAPFIGGRRPDKSPARKSERLLVWLDPRNGRASVQPAGDEQLLVLKMAVEEIAVEAVAAEGRLPVGAVDAALSRAAARGLVLMPASSLRRDPAIFRAGPRIGGEYLSTPSFTLQWHVTQACDLHCKHCYDRSDRSRPSLEQAQRILDGLHAFCRSRNVAGAVSFTGGNPLLHPAFTGIYRAAAERGFATAILGNPAPRARIEELIAIQMPAFFQVSLEGLREHNDEIRGPGHFDRILSFLETLAELRVPSMVMLTLTSGNIDQVLPLGETLRGKTDVFHFNRLSTVGEGAQLVMPDKDRYREFLRAYLAAARTNPVLGIKDNLINIVRCDQGAEPFGGCTGYGCGAAFNFVSLLSDGEVHACRKFPSPLGNIHHRSLAEIYDSEQARRYRAGGAACASCGLRPVCGGCLASTHSHGLNVFEDRDPFCFLQNGA